MSKIIIDMPNAKLKDAVEKKLAKETEVKLKRRIEWLMDFSWNSGKTEEELKQNIIDMYKENGNTIAEGAFDELIPEHHGEYNFPHKFDKTNTI